MLEARDAPARLGDAPDVHRLDDVPHPRAAVPEHLAPGRDDEGVAVGGAAPRHLAHRARSDDHRAVLDRPGAVQHVPVRLARHLGERGRHDEDLRPGLRERAIELGEAKVVADGHAEPAPGGVHQDPIAAGGDDRGLAIALGGGQVHVEEVDLVVAGPDLAAVVDHEAAVDEPVPRSVHRDGADQHPHSGVARESAKRGEHRMALLGGGRRREQPPFALQPPAVLGQAHELRAGRDRVARQPERLPRGFLEGRKRPRLHAANSDFSCRRHRPASLLRSGLAPQNFLYASRSCTRGWRSDIWNLMSSSRAIMSRSCWLSGRSMSSGTRTQPLMLRSNTAAFPSS